MKNCIYSDAEEQPPAPFVLGTLIINMDAPRLSPTKTLRSILNKPTNYKHLLLLIVYFLPVIYEFHIYIWLANQKIQKTISTVPSHRTDGFFSLVKHILIKFDAVEGFEPSAIDNYSIMLPFTPPRHIRGAGNTLRSINTQHN